MDSSLSRGRGTAEDYELRAVRRRREARRGRGVRVRTLRVGSMPTDFKKRRSLMLIRNAACSAAVAPLPLPLLAAGVGRRRLPERAGRRFTPTFASRTM